MTEVAVVLGEAFVDADLQPELVGQGARGLNGAALRAAHQSGDRETGQRVGQPGGLGQSLLGQVRIGPLTGLAP